LAAGSDGIPQFGRPRPNYIHPDVHSVAVHPQATEMVYAPTGGGFYLSEDGGLSWTIRYDDCYCRAVWVDPADPNHLVLGPAGSVDRYGRIEQSKDGGLTWTGLNEGTLAPWPNHMVERFSQIGSRLFAVLSNGELITAEIGQWLWEPVFSDIPNIRGISSMG
jgi:hypothetical protein